MYLEIPQVAFTSCAMDCIGPLPTSLKGHRQALMFICLLASYLITVPMKTKMADEVSMAYIKEILPKLYVLSSFYKTMVLSSRMNN